MQFKKVLFKNTSNVTIICVCVIVIL